MKNLAVNTWLRRLNPPAVAGGLRLAPHFVFACLAAAGVLLIHWPTVVSAMATQGAGLNGLNVAVLAPLAAVWLIWDRRDDVSAVPVRPWWPGLGVIAATSAIWMLGDLADINLARQVALVAMLGALATTVLGLGVARTLAFPLFFLLFAVNAFFPLVPPLMYLAGQLGVLALHLTGVRGVLDGMTILTPFGRWQLIEGCAGLDYVLIFAMSGVLFASLAFRSVARKVMFVVVSIVAAILANGLRTWAVIYAAYARGGVDQDHNAIGWAVFAVAFVTLFAIGKYISQPPREPAHPPAGRPGPVRGCALAALAALAIVGAAPGAVAALENGSRGAAAFDGCQLLGRATLESDPALIVRTRTECSGPSGRRQARYVAHAMLGSVAPDVALGAGVSRGYGSRRGVPFDAATLTTLGTTFTYRLTYWYEIGNIVTYSRVAMRWHLALALLAGHDARVTVVADLHALNDAR